MHIRPTISGLVLAAVLLCANAATASTILIEDFEAAFPAWESGWLGVNSNLQNFYGVGESRGNNPDGLWLDDGDANVNEAAIVFASAFGQSLTSLSLDFIGYVSGTLSIHDSLGALLLTTAYPAFTAAGGALTDPGVYTNVSITSSSGIGRFVFSTSGSDALVGNTSIDNVIVAVRDSTTAPVPEPASLSLLALGLAGFGVRRWRQRKA